MKRTEQEQQIWQLEDEWTGARLHGNDDYSKKLIHDAYRGANTRGLAHDKASLLESIRKYPVTDIQLSGRSVAIYGDTSTSVGVATVTSRAGHKTSYRYLRVYVKSAQTWSLIASQATPIASKN
jgi:Domain of unknown function (DUF4440)